MPLSDITVVILSKDRKSELLGSLRYWDEIGVSFLVLHDTDDPLKYVSKNIESKYFVLRANYGVRCGVAYQKLVTKYGILCADDEIFLPSALSRMCEMLDKNQDIQSVGGQAIALGKYGPIITATQVYSNMVNYENKFESPESRLKFHFNPLHDYKIGGVYRLMRIETLKNILKVFSEIATISTPYIYEITGEILVTAIGKSFYIKEVFWIRNWVNESVVGKQWNRKLYFYRWFESEEFEFERQAWTSSLTKCFRELNHDINLQFFLPLIVSKRKSIEMHEESKKQMRFGFINTYFKYWIKKIIRHSNLPTDLNESINKITATGILLHGREFENASKVIIPISETSIGSR
jgi:glycosyltransferase domain-containing protein